eukprot:tig00000630_g2730.t1
MATPEPAPASFSAWEDDPGARAPSGELEDRALVEPVSIQRLNGGSGGAVDEQCREETHTSSSARAAAAAPQLQARVEPPAAAAPYACCSAVAVAWRRRGGPAGGGGARARKRSGHSGGCGRAGGVAGAGVPVARPRAVDVGGAGRAFVHGAIAGRGRPGAALAAVKAGLRLGAGRQTGRSVGALAPADELGRMGRGLRQPVTAVALLCRGTQILLASADRTLRRHAADTGQLLCAPPPPPPRRLRPGGRQLGLPGLPGDVATIAADHERPLAFSGGSDGAVARWDLEGEAAAAGRVLARRAPPLLPPSLILSPRTPRHDGPVLCVAYAPGLGAVLSGSRDGTLRAWDEASGTPLLCLDRSHGVTGPVTSVAPPPPGYDSFAFACGDLDPTGKEHFAFVRGLSDAGRRWRIPDRAWALALGPDLAHVYLGHQGGDVTAWDVAAARQTARLPAHAPKQVSRLEVHGAALVSAGNDSRVLLYPLPEAGAPAPAPERVSTSHSGAVNGFALRPSDGALFTAGYDHQVHRLDGFASKGGPSAPAAVLVPPAPTSPLALLLHLVLLLAEHFQALKFIVDNMEVYNYRQGLRCPLTGAISINVVEPLGPLTGFSVRGLTPNVAPYWLSTCFMVAFVGVMLACFKGLYGLVLMRAARDRLGAFLRALLENGLWFSSMILSTSAVEQVARAFGCVEGEYSPGVPCWTGPHWPYVLVGPLAAVPFVAMCLRLVAVEGRLMNYGFHLLYWGNDNTAAVLINVHPFSRRSAGYERLRLALALAFGVCTAVIRDRPVASALFQMVFCLLQLASVAVWRPFYNPHVNALRAFMFLGLAASPAGILATEYSPSQGAGRGFAAGATAIPTTCLAVSVGQAAVAAAFLLYAAARLAAAAASRRRRRAHLHSARVAPAAPGPGSAAPLEAA